jgi:hypothetical protein
MLHCVLPPGSPGGPAAAAPGRVSSVSAPPCCPGLGCLPFRPANKTIPVLIYKCAPVSGRQIKGSIAAGSLLLSRHPISSHTGATRQACQARLCTSCLSLPCPSIENKEFRHTHLFVHPSPTPRVHRNSSPLVELARFGMDGHTGGWLQLPAAPGGACCLCQLAMGNRCLLSCVAPVGQGCATCCAGSFLSFSACDNGCIMLLGCMLRCLAEQVPVT